MNSKRHARLRQHQRVRKEARRLGRLIGRRLSALLPIRYDEPGRILVREVILSVLDQEGYL